MKIALNSRKKMETEEFEIDLANTSSVSLPKDVGLYWIHCNRCFEIYVHRRRRILLLACLHTICESCVGTSPAGASSGCNEVICPLCKKTQRFRVLCNVMPAHFKELLNPEPWREPNERILRFQAKQRESFKKGMFHKLIELDKIRRKCKMLEVNSKKKYERYEQLRVERRRLEREVRSLKEQESQQKSMRIQTAQRNNKRFATNATGMRFQAAQRSNQNNRFFDASNATGMHLQAPQRNNQNQRLFSANNATGARFQAAQGNNQQNRFVESNAFFAAKRAGADDRTRSCSTGSNRTQRSMSNNSFSFSLM